MIKSVSWNLLYRKHNAIVDLMWECFVINYEEHIYHDSDIKKTLNCAFYSLQSTESVQVVIKYLKI